MVTGALLAIFTFASSYRRNYATCSYIIALVELYQQRPGILLEVFI
jgi:hypothetical protein